MSRATWSSPITENRFFLPILFLFSLLSAGAFASQAQAAPFDYGEDVEPVPATISIDLKAGEHKIVESAYQGIKEKLSGSLIRMENFTATTSPGDPMLPVRSVEIAVPPNIDWKTLKLSYDTGSANLLEGEYDMLPAPPGRARVEDEELVDWGEGKDIVDERNRNVYGKDAFFPAEPVRIVARSQMRKWKYVRLEYSPFQYNPVKRRIRATGPIKIQLNFMRIGKQAYRGDPLLGDTLMDKEAESRFINFKEAQECSGGRSAVHCAHQKVSR